jgi:hypothetical protein
LLDHLHLSGQVRDGVADPIFESVEMRLRQYSIGIQRAVIEEVSSCVDRELGWRKGHTWLPSPPLPHVHVEKGAACAECTEGKESEGDTEEDGRCQLLRKTSLVC